RLKWRIKVDLPEPDRPMMTKMLPSSMDRLISRKPSVWPLLASSSSLLTPLRASSSQRSGCGPNILYILRTSILLMSGSLALTPAEFLRDAVEDDGDDDNTQAGQHAAPDLQAVDALKHLIAQAAHTDHGRNDDHGQRHHCRLVDARHDVGHGKGQLHAKELLETVGAKGPGSLQHFAVYQPYAQVRQPDHRGNRVNDGRDDGRDLAQIEQHHDRDKV